jgi:hypothetical protein
VQLASDHDELGSDFQEWLKPFAAGLPDEASAQS